MLPWERVSHGTHGKITGPRSLGKGCEGARARATTARVGSSHPEQEGLSVETVRPTFERHRFCNAVLRGSGSNATGDAAVGHPID